MGTNSVFKSNSAHAIKHQANNNSTRKPSQKTICMVCPLTIEEHDIELDPCLCCHRDPE